MTRVHTTSLLRRSVQGSVTIDRPPAETWGFYHDFHNIPRIVGDVCEVSDRGEGRWRWMVELPLGLRVGMDILVEEAVASRSLRYRTTSRAPLTAEWRLGFWPVAGGRATRVREVLTGPLGPPVGALLALLGKHPQAEVEANLLRLKSVVEGVTADRPPRQGATR